MSVDEAETVVDGVWIKDDLGWFLDHWLIVRKDRTTVLNGTPEDFEKALRELLS